MIVLSILKKTLFCVTVAEGLQAPRLVSPFHSQTPAEITAIEFHPKGNAVIPRSWNNADKPGQDGWVKEMLGVSIAVFITQENLQIHEHTVS